MGIINKRYWVNDIPREDVFKEGTWAVVDEKAGGNILYTGTEKLACDVMALMNKHFPFDYDHTETTLLEI